MSSQPRIPKAHDECNGDFSPTTTGCPLFVLLSRVAHKTAAIRSRLVRTLRPWRRARGHHSNLCGLEPKSIARRIREKPPQTPQASLAAKLALGGGIGIRGIV